MERIIPGNVQASDKAFKLFKAIITSEQQCKCKASVSDAVYWAKPCPACSTRFALCFKFGQELKLGPWEWPYLKGPKDSVDPSKQWQLDAQKRYRDFQMALGR